MAVERDAVPLVDCWNVETLYPSLQEWDKEFRALCPEKTEATFWPHLAKQKGHLGENAKVLAECLLEIVQLDRELTKLYTYAHLKHDEDIASPRCKEAYESIIGYLHAFRLETSWVEPEIQTISDEKMEGFLKDPLLKDFWIALKRTRRLRSHTLSEREEHLLALSGRALGSVPKTFEAMNNADLKFGKVMDKEGKTHELTHGTYQRLMRSHDRTLRENAFKTMLTVFGNFENTFCELIHGEVQNHIFEARARSYPSCMEAALFPHEIDPAVYHNLIDAVRRGIKALHRYMEIRKKFLGVQELHMYDLHVPLVQDVDISMSFDEAVQAVIASVAPLGESYKKALSKGLLEERWVDRYENLRKRSGAYSSGCYDSSPYILMNYQGIFSDVLTLAHECGHSMHSLLSRQRQLYQYAQYPIFLAEVASTFNEELLIEYLLTQLKDPMQKAFIINQEIEDIRSTFFRQTMFAEFELQLHTWGEERIPLTPSLLKTAYIKLNREYFGENVVVDEELAWEWARIPHFYYNFYVYQYATGISAASALVRCLHEQGESARKAYLEFLSSGCVKGPLELLQLAGVDMHEPRAVEATIARFVDLVDRLDKELSLSHAQKETRPSSLAVN